MPVSRPENIKGAVAERPRLPGRLLVVGPLGLDRGPVALVSPLKVLFVGKRPSPESVAVGHYFQGRHGKMFWNKLREYGILEFDSVERADDFLLKQGFGMTDVVKIPARFGQATEQAPIPSWVTRCPKDYSNPQA